MSAALVAVDGPPQAAILGTSLPHHVPLTVASDAGSVWVVVSSTDKCTSASPVPLSAGRAKDGQKKQ